MSPQSRQGPKDMIAAARKVRRQAWVPYSKFKVGAALRTPDGRIFAGCNVENAAYPQSSCAEASAISCMVSAGARRIAEVVVVGGGTGPCTPCGGCRQRLAEFAAAGTSVHMVSPAGRVLLSTTLGALLPHAFGPINLKGTGGDTGRIAAIRPTRPYRQG